MSSSSGHWTEGDDDLDGRAHYRALGLPLNASPHQVRSAYLEVARSQHPDKGGTAAAFARIRRAYEVLSDPAQRRVYDALAHDVRSRHLRDHLSRQSASDGPDGPEDWGEASLLDELSRQGLKCDPKTQLVVTCELCRRPATITCWICSAPICSFCTRRQHWKGVWPLHWPVVNSAHMEAQLGRREMEQKRKEDALRYELEDPHYLPPAQRAEARRFQEAALRAYGEAAAATAAAAAADRGAIAAGQATAASAHLGSAAAAGGMELEAAGPLGYCPGLARYYKWCQTAGVLYVACHVPTVQAGGSVQVDSCQHSSGALVLRLQAQGALPVLHRTLAYAVDPSMPVDTVRVSGGQLVGLMIAKARPGQKWSRLFAGDSDGARCTDAPVGFMQQPPGPRPEPESGTAEVKAGAGALPGPGVSPAKAKAGDLASPSLPADPRGGAGASLPPTSGAPPLAADSWGCPASYSLTQLQDEVVLELQVPFWVRPEDVRVSVTATGLHLLVDGLLDLRRSFWGVESLPGPALQVVSQCGPEAAGGGEGSGEDVHHGGGAGQYAAVLPDLCTWTLTAKEDRAQSSSGSGSSCSGGGRSAGANSRQPKLLSVVLALPPPNQEEVTYKKGVRQDHRTAQRQLPGGGSAQGRHLFLEDEDEFNLEPLLQAMVFRATGRAHVPSRPWGSGLGSTDGFIAQAAHELPQESRAFLKMLSEADPAPLQEGASNGSGA